MYHGGLQRLDLRALRRLVEAQPDTAESLQPRLNLRTGAVTDLVTDADGACRDPQVHYDGGKVLFSYRKGGTENYNLYEVNVDGSGLRPVTSGPFDDIEPTYLPDGDIVFCSSALLFNESRPELSLALLAPLAKDAGGYGVCPGPVFADRSDPDYQRLLAALTPPSTYLATAVLHHMPGFAPNEHYVREMNRYGILPDTATAGGGAIDVYETDQAYWRSLWHVPSGR